MPRRAPWHHRLAALTALLTLTVGAQLSLAAVASAGVSGSIWRSHAPLTAVCTPADAISASGSASAVVPVVVSVPAGAKTTTTTFLVIPSGPVIQGTPVVLVAQVAPAGVAGAIQFKDGDTDLGASRPVVDGFALTVTSMLTLGDHSLTAMFTPADQVAFGPSAPPPVSLTVIGRS